MRAKMMLIDDMQEILRDAVDEMMRYIEDSQTLSEKGEEDEEARTRRIISGDDEIPKRKVQDFKYLVDASKYTKIVDLVFNPKNVSVVYISHMTYMGDKVMVVFINGVEYFLLYNEKIYNSIVEEIEKIADQ